MGTLFAFIALISWGIGDFLIQKGARRFGNWITLFYITALVSITLFPFIYNDLLSAIENNFALLVLLIASIIILFAALFDLQALKIGKISVVEPIYALEVPVTALLATIIIGEYLSTGQIIAIFFLLIGILFISISSFSQFKNFRWEKGIWYAILATITMGTVNFIFGISARQTSPLLINWFTSSFICLVSIFYLAHQNKFKEIIDSFKKNKRLILSVGIIDNLAWIAYAYSTVYIPIAVATSISEGYIALAAGLGLIFNKEKLKNHQIIGLIIAVVSVIILAKITR